MEDKTFFLPVQSCSVLPSVICILFLLLRHNHQSTTCNATISNTLSFMLDAILILIRSSSTSSRDTFVRKEHVNLMVS